jgi:hypothetical protein
MRHQYKLRRLKKLSIRPLTDKSGQKIERSLAEILRELRDRQLIMKSPGRTFANLFEL